uniref:Cytidylate kinase n=1 Tax=candidate division WOR-3 bacterium TaxID=2052148 RepID=A0A7C6A9V8_UNCW3
MPKGFVVAIDGTAGSGKSTTARKVAEALGFFYLDTGAMYRAMTWKILKAKVDLCDTEKLKELVTRTKIDFTKDNRVILDGKDVSEEIRKPAVDKLVSQVSALALVRAKMVQEQRKLAKNRNVICEGRDIGSVVFPKACLKLYLDCDLAERTKRRAKELSEKGIKVKLKEIKENFIERDYIDSTRDQSPLKKLPDAVYLDTTNLTIEEEVKIVTDMVKDRLKKKGREPQRTR